MGFPIRKSADDRLCAPTRSLSQLITSFVATESQGIRQLLLITFKYLLYQYVKELFDPKVNCNNFGIEPNSIRLKQTALSNELIINTSILLSRLKGCENQPPLKNGGRFLKKVENIGVEPMTSCVQGRRSSQLS